MAGRKPGDQRPEMPTVRIAPLRELKVYQVSETELDRLASGSPGQVHLSFALALLPSALTVLITLQTIEIKNARLYYSYLIAFWMLSVQGFTALIQWWRTSDSMKTLVQ